MKSPKYKTCKDTIKLCKKKLAENQINVWGNQIAALLAEEKNQLLGSHCFLLGRN